MLVQVLLAILVPPQQIQYDFYQKRFLAMQCQVQMENTFCPIKKKKSKYFDGFITKAAAV